MTGMTPERLDAIRANLPTPDADLSRRERDAHDLLDEVDRLRHENADLRRSRDERKATERRRRTEDREAWMRAQEAEVRADERAKVLAEHGVAVEHRVRRGVHSVRLVSPWEPTP